VPGAGHPSHCHVFENEICETTVGLPSLSSASGVGGGAILIMNYANRREYWLARGRH
jgi:hypothetical protein